MAQSKEAPPAFESRSMPLPEETEAEKLLTRRVHILGLGSIGTLIAHSLKCLPNAPPITLMMHHADMYQDFGRKGRIVRLINPKTQINDEQTGYDVDLLETHTNDQKAFWRFIPHEQNYKSVNEVSRDEVLDTGELFIYSMIVTVKGPATVNALLNIRHRVDSKTTICLMQNGMGQIEELNRQVFTDPATRPTYLLGVISHGSYMEGRFVVVHAGFGTTALGIYRDPDKFPLPSKSSKVNPAELSEGERRKLFPSDKDLYSNLSSRFLLRTLTRSPILACAAFPFIDLVQLQLEKLVMNAILNPLTALLDVKNGRLLGQESITRIQRLLLAEIAVVIRGLPELDGVPNVRMRFATDRLENLVIGIANKTAANSSSMREDIRKHRKTEIDYINGYIVRRGEEQGIKCVLNYMLMQLVKAKDVLDASENVAFEPYGSSNVDAEVKLDDIGSSTGVVLQDHGPAERPEKL